MTYTIEVVDNTGAKHLFVVAAPGREDAIDKAKAFYRRSAAKGTWPVSAQVLRNGGAS